MKGKILLCFHCLLQCLVGDLPRSRRAIHFPSVPINMLLVVLAWSPLVYVGEVWPPVLAPSSPSLPDVPVASQRTPVSKPFPGPSLRLVLPPSRLPLCIILVVLWLLLSSSVFIMPEIFSKCFPMSWSFTRTTIMWWFMVWRRSPPVVGLL